MTAPTDTRRDAPTSTSPFPISLDDVRAARERIAPFLAPTPLRSYELLDDAMGGGTRVLVKHENFQPTGAFKIRNALSFMTALDPERRSRGVVAATRGNHGLGVSWAARAFGVPATICVPIGNNPEKNAGMRALGARVIEEGVDYDVAIGVADRVQRETGATIAHSTNDRDVIAGAGTMTLEILEQASSLDALVLVVGGGSQAVGAIAVSRALAPHVQVYAVQATGASATHDAWHTGELRVAERADTFADGMATRSPYAMTFPALQAGLAGFITVTDAEIADAMRLLLRTTHTLVEGAGAGGLAGLLRLREQLAGRTVAIAISGGNVDAETLRRVMAGEL